jgi:alkanesulfonate monooxygenase SsuD/methylene tetrahydromethanopterin reductase-like flavin-dependent oxidoreductase (luciferase family)
MRLVRYCVSLQTDQVAKGDEFVSGTAIAEVARTAEAAGFDAVFVTEHPFPENEWLATGGHHALDPFVALTWAAAATTRLRMLTNLCVVPYRNPYLLAKAAVTLDAVSDGRLILGCGAGYLEAEFAALDQEFGDRNDRFDAAITAMQAAWTGEPVRWPAPGVRTPCSRDPCSRPIRRSGSAATRVARCGAPSSSETGGCRSRTRPRARPGARRPRCRRSSSSRPGSRKRTSSRPRAVAPCRT